MDERSFLGTSIRMFRESAGMTQDELCKIIGASRTTITNWETCSSSPDASLIPKIADALQVSIDDLFTAVYRAGSFITNEKTDPTFGDTVKDYIDRAGGLSLEAAELCSKIITEDIQKKKNDRKGVREYEPISFPIFLCVGDPGYFEMREKMKELRKLKRKNQYSYSDIGTFLNDIDCHYGQHVCLAYLFLLFNGEKVPSKQLYERIYSFLSIPKRNSVR